MRTGADERARQDFPAGLSRHLIPFDTTRFVRNRSTKSVKTLLIAAVLVILVVFVFLQSWRATLIPVIAVPVSLIGAFAGLYVFTSRSTR
jgi:multidrug efflux pump subunit AcrB